MFTKAEIQRRYYHRHKADRDRYRIELYRRLRQDVLAAYGNRCACCGETEPLFLHLDHIYNDGSRRRKQGWEERGQRLYAQVKRAGFPKDRFQLLCANCNMGKARSIQMKLAPLCPHELRVIERILCA